MVCEFGSAHDQDVADGFVLNLESVAPDDLEQIWRTTMGGQVYWAPPVRGSASCSRSPAS